MRRSWHIASAVPRLEELRRALARRKPTVVLAVVCLLATLMSMGGVIGGMPLANGFFATGSMSHHQPISHSTRLIAQENQKPGTDAWLIDDQASRTFLQAYAGAVSARAGDQVPLYVSSMRPTRYDLSVYRIGWYQGLGGHLYLSATNLESADQGYWTPSTGLMDCPTCTFAPGTDLIAASWAVSYTIHIGTDWPTGVYLIQLISTPYGTNAETYIPLVVRDDQSTSNILASLPVNTYQAYNWWGGYSLYTHVRPGATSIAPSAEDHAQMVSFDRPYARSYGGADFFAWDAQAIRWIERNGYDVSYTTNVDVSEHASLLLNHRAFVSIGHDEYLSRAMRDGITVARDQGVSLAFLGADDSYWQVRYGPDAAGTPDRTLICFKVATNSTDPRYQPRRDPDYPSRRDLVTSLWRDPIVNDPENSLLGAMFLNDIQEDGQYHPDWVVSNASDPFLAGTGLRPGQHVSGGLLGYEYDGLAQNGRAPSHLITIASSPVIDPHNPAVTHLAVTTIYQAPSGALVFDAGSIWWSWGLDALVVRGTDVQNSVGGNTGVQQLMRNILDAMIA